MIRSFDPTKPIIDIPGLIPQPQVRPPMLASLAGVPMLQPGAAPNTKWTDPSTFQGQFPPPPAVEGDVTGDQLDTSTDQNTQTYQAESTPDVTPAAETATPAPVRGATPEPASASEPSVAASSPQVAPSQQGQGGGFWDSLVNGFRGPQMANKLAMLGIGLQSMGGPYGRDPFLQRIAYQGTQQRQESAAMAETFKLMGAASQAPTAAEGLQIIDAGLKNPVFNQNPKAVQMLTTSRDNLIGRSHKEQQAAKIQAVTKQLQQQYGENIPREAFAQALLTGGITDEGARGLADKLTERYRWANTPQGIPVRIDTATGKVEQMGNSQDPMWQPRQYVDGKRVAPYKEGNPVIDELPKDTVLGRDQSLIRTAPGKDPETLASRGSGLTTEQKAGFAFLQIDPMAQHTPEQLAQAQKVGTLAEKGLNPEVIRAALKHNQLDAFLGLQGNQQQAAASVGQSIQGEHVARSAATGTAAVKAKADAEMQIPLAMVPGQAGTEVWDRKERRFVDKFGVSIAQMQADPRRYAVPKEEDRKVLHGATMIRNFVPILEEVAKRVTNQPTESVWQAIELTVKDKFGAEGMGTVINGLQGSKLLLGRVFQGAGSGLSNNDVQSVDNLVPKKGDTAWKVRQKAGLLQTYADLMEASAVGDDALAQKTLFNFVRNVLPAELNSKEGTLPGGKSFR